MKSRGFAWSMSDRTRRGLTLSWLVLFVLSVLMQYGSLTAPSTALAVHDDGLFELDGNADNEGTPGDDWAAVYGGTSSANITQFIVDPVDDNADETFTGGETKDDEPIGDWLWKHAKASQAKNDITHAFAASYTDDDGHAIVYFGLNKYEADGNNFVGFWFVQEGVALTGDGNPPGSPFVGEHVVGDILVLANYTNGGALADFDVFEWVGSGGDANAAGTLNTVASGVPCTGAPATDLACGATNSDNEASPWPYTARDADLPGEANTFLPGTFFEGGIDLTALELDDTCVSTFIAETRASQSVDATLSDFALGGFDTCGSVTIVKDAIPNDAQDFTFGGDLGAFSLDDDGDATLPNSITFNQVDPGSYDVSELSIPANWELIGLTCDDGASDTPSTVNLGTATATINVDPVEDVTCTFTNTRYGRILVDKVTNPSGSSQQFEFDPSYGSNFFLTDAVAPNDSGFLAPGTYSVAEVNIPAGWDLTSATCSDGSPVNAIDLALNETVTCTFNNRQDGRILVDKITDPSGSSQQFEFDPSYGSNFFLTDASAPNDSGFLDPGTYSVVELTPDGWDLSSVSCSDGSANTAINLGAGETVTCTFNNRQDGQIVVVKQTTPDGSPQSFEFDPSWGGNFFLTDGQSNNSGNLDPGTYSVAELTPAGWDLTSATCSDGSAVDAINLGAGEVVTCTFNNRQDGHIIVVKQTLPDGSNQSFEFDPSWGGNFNLTDGQSSDSGNLDPGTYSVAEVNIPAGWDLTSATCDQGETIADITLGAGETVTCTFTNTQRGHIVVDKVTLPGGDPQSFSFTTGGAGYVGFSLTDAAAPNDQEVLPGTYSVSETVPAGWDLTSAACDQGETIADITVGPGETVTCTFTNTKRGHIVVDKVTDPSGDPQSFSFTTTGAGYSGFSLTDAAAPNNQEVVPGTYSVSETVPAGWDLTSATCDQGETPASLDVEPGETVTCTFTNTKRGTIIVEKQTSPDGAEGEFDFTGDGAGTIGDGGTIVVSNLQPGTYTSTEADPTPDFDLTSILCDDTNSSGDLGTRTATFELDPGETVTCTFTNVQRGTITIIKDAQPNDAQDFGYDVSGFDGPIHFELDDDANGTLLNMETFENVPPGDYSVTEGAVDGWDLTDLDCVVLGGSSAQIDGATANLTMAAGGSITCTYVNSKPSISIVKTAGDAADGEVLVQGPGEVTYSYLVTNTGPIALVNIQVWDDNGTADTADDFQADCPASTLAAGDSMTCTATVAVNESRTNVAEATGASEQGTEVSDTDDAEVRVPGISIVKSNDDTDGIVGQGQTVTFTINVSVTEGPVTNAVVTDVLPDGQTYVDGSQSSNPASTFVVSPDGTTLTWTFASLPTGDPAASISYDVTIDSGALGSLTNVAEVCVDEPGVPCDDDDSTVEVPALVIDKSYTGNTGGTAINGVGIAKVGDTLTYTLAYDLTGGPVHNGVITDTLPVGLTYVAASATNSDEFTFVSYDNASRTLTWHANVVTEDGTVTYKVTVDADSFDLPQPLVNVATIDSDETPEDDAEDDVLVQEVLQETSPPTLPPTDSIDNGDQAPSSSGFGLMLALLVLAGVGLVAGYLTPTPGRTRREVVRRR